jgi:uncharacterized protein YdiU (UPF0061 family)
MARSSTPRTGWGLRRKLGLVEAQEGDTALANDLLARMARTAADFTLAFRQLADLADGAGPGPRDLFGDPAAFDGWRPAWQARLDAEPMAPDARAALMRASSPAIIPRNHLVEAALEAAVQRDDLAPFETLLDAVTHPFADRPGFGPPAAPAEGYRTFAAPDRRARRPRARRRWRSRPGGPRAASGTPPRRRVRRAPSPR